VGVVVPNPDAIKAMADKLGVKGDLAELCANA